MPARLPIWPIETESRPPPPSTVTGRLGGVEEIKTESAAAPTLSRMLLNEEAEKSFAPVRPVVLSYHAIRVKFVLVLCVSVTSLGPLSPLARKTPPDTPGLTVGAIRDSRCSSV